MVGVCKFEEDQVLVFVISAGLLLDGVRKLRNPERHDWIDKKLCDHLDNFERTYIHLKHSGASNKKRRNTKSC
jgi:hypothetical protein